MIKQLCLIVIVAIGLIILMPGMNVAAKSNLHHSNFIAHMGFGIGAIMKFKQHKDNPTQIRHEIHHGKR
ncbi:MAG TPA: hypothetical protein VIY08_01795 [Candidatus Nitrosocosmicus sp.]